MARVEIDEAQHELERAALQLEEAARLARWALESEWEPKMAERALLDAQELVTSATRILNRETSLARVS